MKQSVRIGLTATVVIIGMTLAGCASLPLFGSKAPTKAVAVLRPLQGSTVQGTVSFIQEGSSVRAIAVLSGLTPGKHGIHIHEFGDCTAADGSSLGGHFNPGNTMHAGPEDKERHVGDLGTSRRINRVTRNTIVSTRGSRLPDANPSSSGPS